jgi:hypothetical protein
MKYSKISITFAILICSTFMQLVYGQCKTTWNRILASNGTCICEDGYYDTGANPCSACSNNCLTCVTAAANCLSCDSSKHLTLSSSTCVCMDGYVRVLGVCQSCHYTCLTCSNTTSNGCLTCDSSIRTMIGTKCICLNGTYDNSTAQLC